MMRQSRFFLFLLLLSIAAPPLPAQGIRFRKGTLKEIFLQAKAGNKAVFIHGFTENCAPCVQMETETYSDADIGKFFNDRFVSCKLNLESEEGEYIRKNYAPKSSPVILFLNDQGELLYAENGVVPPQWLKNSAQRALNPEENLAGKTRKFKAGNRDPKFLSEYIQQLNRCGQDFQHPLTVWKEQIRPKDLKWTYNWEVFKGFFLDVDHKLFRYALSHQAQLGKFHTDYQVQSGLVNIYFKAMITAVQQQDELEYERIREKLLASGLENAPQTAIYLETWRAEQRGDWDAYIEMATEIAENHAKDNWNLLDELAFKCQRVSDDPEVLRRALKWAQQSVALDENYFNLCTYAVISYKLGEEQEAIGTLEKALDMAKENPEIDVADAKMLLRKWKG